MNTFQLVVICYAGLAGIAVLLFEALTENSSTYLLAAIAASAGLLVYLLKPHPLARKRWVAVSILVPILVGALWFAYEDRRTARALESDRLASMGAAGALWAKNHLDAEFAAVLERTLNAERNGTLSPAERTYLSQLREAGMFPLPRRPAP